MSAANAERLPNASGESAQPSWRSWSYQVWAEHLLEHYFARSGENGGPVRTLNVSDAELARIVDDPTAEPAEVSSQLIDATVRAAKSVDRSFWTHAESRTGMAKPFYLSHLIVACIAVTDASDADENSNIERIAHLTDGTSGDQNLEALPELWGELQEWLEGRPNEYRPLVLPDPRLDPHRTHRASGISEPPRPTATLRVPPWGRARHGRPAARPCTPRRRSAHQFVQRPIP